MDKLGLSRKLSLVGCILIYPTFLYMLCGMLINAIEVNWNFVLTANTLGIVLILVSILLRRGAE